MGVQRAHPSEQRLFFRGDTSSNAALRVSRRVEQAAVRHDGLIVVAEASDRVERALHLLCEQR